MVDWEDIQKTHGQTVWSVAYRILAHEEDARDCFQEVFLEAFGKSNADAVGNWGGFLRWLATRRAIDLLRTRRRQRTVALADQEFPAPALVSRTVEWLETIEAVRQELTQLPESQATAFWLFSVEGLSYQDIADHTRSNVNSVGLLIYRARQRLKLRLSTLASDWNDQKSSIAHE